MGSLVQSRLPQQSMCLTRHPAESRTGWDQTTTGQGRTGNTRGYSQSPWQVHHHLGSSAFLERNKWVVFDKYRTIPPNTYTTRKQISTYPCKMISCFVNVSAWFITQQGKSERFESCDRPSELQLLDLCDFEMELMTLENNIAPFLCLS